MKFLKRALLWSDLFWKKRRKNWPPSRKNCWNVARRQIKGDASNKLRTYVEHGEEEVTYEAMECSRTLHYTLVQHYLLRTEHYLSRRGAFFLFINSQQHIIRRVVCVFYCMAGRRKKGSRSHCKKFCSVNFVFLGMLMKVFIWVFCSLSVKHCHEQHSTEGWWTPWGIGGMFIIMRVRR